MLDRIIQRAREGRSYTPEPMGWVESLILTIAPGAFFVWIFLRWAWGLA